MQKELQILGIKNNLLRPLFRISCSLSTCVKAHAFQAPNKGHFEAQYKCQSLLFEIWLNKLLLGKKLPKLQNTCYKVSWGGKMTATQSSTIPLSVQRLKWSSFVTFSERAPFLRRFLCWYLWCFLSQRCIGVSKRWWKKKNSTGSQFDNFPLKFVSLLFQICFFRPNCFQIPPLDGVPQRLIHLNLVNFKLNKDLKKWH